MALPLSRNTTYAVGSQVKSADLNDLQDQVIAIYALLSKPFQHSIGMVAPGDATAALLTGNSGGGTSPRFNLNTSVVEHVLPLAIPVGVITGYSVKVNKTSAAGTVSVKLIEGANGSGVGGVTQIGSTQSNSASNPGEITLGESGLSFAMTAGRQYYLVIQGGGTTGDTVSIYSATVAPE